MKISLDSPFFEKGERVGELFMAGFLWLIFSIPVITAGAASSALYYTTVKVVRRKRNTVWRSFWGAFRDSFKQGTAITLLYLLLAVILGFGIAAGKNLQNGTELSALAAAGFVTALPFVLILPWVFPVISRFQAGLFRQIQYAFYMAVRHFPTTLFLLLLLFSAVLLTYMFPFCLIILPGVYTFLSSVQIEKVMKSYMKKEIDKYEDSEELPWYLE